MLTQLCREHAAKVELLMEVSIEKGAESSEKDREEFWIPFASEAHRISEESEVNANKVEEFRAVKKQTLPALPPVPTMLVAPTLQAETPKYPIAIVSPKKISWWGREVKIPVKAVLKLIGFTKGT
jgi:hypothetical protein